MDFITSIIPKISAWLTSLLVMLSTIFTPLTTRIDTMKTVTEIDDGLYVMDISYDYNSMEILENGVDSNISLIINGIKSIFGQGKAFGCTTFNSVTADGDYLLSRNFDYMDSPSMLVRTDPDDGYASISTVSLYFVGYELRGMIKADDTEVNILTLLAPYIPLDGINEKGLSIGVLELETDPTFQISLKKNLTTTSIIRACLDHAATVEEAVEIFESHDMRDLLFDGCKYHYQIADASGNSAIIEYYENKMYVLYPEEDQNNKVNYQAATNFHLIDGAEDPDGMGQDRYELVMDALKSSKGVTSEKEAMNILKSTSMDHADLHGYICSTLWSNVFNMNDKTVSVCYFGNYDKTYTFSVDKPLLQQIN